jgi:hypothetical protein
LEIREAMPLAAFLRLAEIFNGPANAAVLIDQLRHHIV